ncbi:MAG: hypothetical protein KAS39_07090 [Actinomycetia bacterium]|nr:hypothetical protein [Actinomycetes bacterium]
MIENILKNIYPIFLGIITELIYALSIVAIFLLTNILLIGLFNGYFK